MDRGVLDGILSAGALVAAVTRVHRVTGNVAQDFRGEVKFPLRSVQRKAAEDRERIVSGSCSRRNRGVASP